MGKILSRLVKWFVTWLVIIVVGTAIGWLLPIVLVVVPLWGWVVVLMVVAVALFKIAVWAIEGSDYV